MSTIHLSGLGLLVLLGCLLPARGAAPPMPADPAALQERDRVIAAAEKANRTGRRSEAMTLYRRALALEEQLAGKKTIKTAALLHALGSVYQGTGKLTEAEAAYRAALAIRREALGEANPDTAAGYGNLALTLQAQSRFAQAQPLFEKVLAIHRKVMGEEHPSTARSYSHLASCLQQQSKHAQARLLYEKALAIQRKVLGDAHLETARSYNNVASCLNALGRYQEALPLYQKAIAIRTAAGYNDLTAWLPAPGMSSQARLDKKAESLFRRTLEINHRILGERHPVTAVSYGNLAACLLEQGKHLEALPLFEKALAIRRATLPKGHPDTAISLTNLARCRQAMGQYAKAVPLLQEALAIRKSALGEKHPAYAASLNDLGTLLAEEGELVKAVEYLREAIRIRQQLYPATSFPNGHPDLAQGLHDLGMLLLEYGQVRSAESYLQDALKMRRTLYPSAAYPLAHPDLVESLAANGVLQQAGANPDKAAEAFLGALHLHEAHLRQAGVQPRERTASLARFRRDLSRLASLGTQPKAVAKLYELTLAWKSHLPPHKSALVGPNTIANIQNALPAGAVLVELCEYMRSAPPKGVGRWSREQRLLAFIVHADKPVACLDLGPTAGIARAVGDWRQAISGADKAATTAGQELRKAVWLPIEKAVGGADTILIAPDGALGRLPFAALPGRKTGSYLLEEVRIGYVPSGLHLLEWQVRPARGADGLLLVGGLDFGKAVKPAGWAPLPGTRIEAEHGQKVFRARFPGAAVSLLQRKSARKPDLLRALAGPRNGEAWRCIHLATHVCSPQAGSEAGESGGWGLVLSGGNEEAAGRLMAEEIARIDLQGTELVVLSMCRSALSHRPEEVNLQRACHAAGARSVVGSLWELSDAATALLMAEFHTNLWTKNLPRLEALRQAQLFVLRNPRRIVALQREIGDKAMRGKLGKKPVRIGAGTTTTSPPVWWAGFILSGAID